MRAKEIRELVKIVEKSKIDELEVTKWWGQKIRIRKERGDVISEAPVTTTKAIEAQALPSPNAVSQTDIKREERVDVKPLSSVSENSEFIELKAPMVGTFYRSPSPDAESFVNEGENVSKGQVLCIIEAMKLMNEIEAECDGRIVKILASNAQPIEYNQPLFLIDPS